jgi:hypothetical protein
MALELVALELLLALTLPRIDEDLGSGLPGDEKAHGRRGG